MPELYERDLSDGFREALYAQHTDNALALLVTLRLTLADGTVETLRITNIPGGLESNGNQFAYEPMDMGLPSVSESGAPRVQLRLDYVDRDIGQRLRAAMEATGDLELALAAAPNDVEISWGELILGQPQWDVRTMVVPLGYDSADRDPYPGIKMTPETAPGIH